MTATREGVATRGRPARRRAADTRAQILVAARRLFIDEGWAAFTTRRVARDAGVSLGSLQHFFLNLLALGCHDAFAARLVNEIYARCRRRLAAYIALARPELAESECLDLGLQVATLILGNHVYTAPDARAVASRAQLGELVKRSVLRLIG